MDPIVLHIVQLAIMFIGFVILGSIQAYIAKQNKKSLELLNESNAYMNIVNSILELKKWAVKSDPVMKSLTSEEKVVKQILSDKVANDATDLMDRCIFFYHLEKIFHLSEKSPREVHTTKDGFTNEIDMWLTIPGMENFFRGFCMKHATHTKSFIHYVDQFYKRPKKDSSPVKSST